MILHRRLVRQAVDRDDHDDFVEEVVVTGGAVPLAMVRKRSATADATRATVLLVHGFGQNHHAFHLPSRSFANHLARQGFDVFNLDLRGHGGSRELSKARVRSVRDYVDEDLPTALEEIAKHTENQRVFVIGHSLGGLVAVGMRTIGAVMRTLRLVSDGPLPMPLRGWRPGAVEPHILDEHLRLAFDHAGLDEMLTMFDWANAKRFGGYREAYVEQFESLDIPLLVIAGDDDELAPPASVRPAFVRSGSLDKTFRSLPFGHVDMLVGRDAPRSMWPLVERWLLRRA